MSWLGIEGHDSIVERFRRALASGRLASSFLFVGKPGIGKRTFALKLAQALLCESPDAGLLEPCGRCDACLQAAAHSHPDLDLVERPPDKNVLPVDLFIGDREHRMKEGLCPRLARKPFRGGRKIAIVNDADLLHEESANCLLKTLEEPPPGSVLILIGVSEHRQLPTIRSRCQIVRFQPLDADTVARLLVKNGHCENLDQARQWASLAQGSLEQAIAVSAEGVAECRQLLLDHLSDPDPLPEPTCSQLVSFVEAAGKDASVRRDRLRLATVWGHDFYLALVRALADTPVEADPALRQAVASAKSRWPQDQEAAALCLECCLDAHDLVERNVNTRTLVEWWLDELALIARTGAGTAHTAWLSPSGR